MRRRSSAEILAVKRAVRRRDGMCCTKCGMTNDYHRFLYRRTLDVHRLKPGAIYTVAGCVTLCIPCHSKEDRLQRGEVDQELIGVRLVLSLSQHVREALLLESRKQGRSQSAVVEDMLRTEFAASIVKVQEHRAKRQS